MIVEELIGVLGLKVDEAQWAKGERAVEGIKHGLEGIKESSFGEFIKRGIEIFAGYEAVKKIGEFVEQTMNAAIEAKHLGERVGLTSEAVQELGYAASVTGSSSEGMTIGMQHLARGLQELRTKGTGPAVDALHALKVPLNDAEIRHGKLDQVLEIVANRFASLPDGVAKTSIAMDLFGREGTTLIPLLNKGAAGIKELRVEAERLGVVIDKEGIEKAEELERTEKKLHATLTGLRNQAVIALLPALQDMANSVLAWVQANRELIATKLHEFVDLLARGMRFLGKVVLIVIDALGWLQKHAFLAGLAIAGMAALFAPWTSLIIGIVAVIRDVWESITEGKGYAADAVRYITDKFEALGNFLKNIWAGIVKTAKDAWKAIKDLPIVGRAIKFVSGGDPINTGNLAAHAISAAGTATPSVPGAQNAAPVHIEGGDISISVTSSGDAKAIGEEVAKQVKDAQKDMVRQAMDAVKGGRK